MSASALRLVLRRFGWARRAHGAIGGWRLSGWSLRWLILHTPVLGPFVWRLWGLVSGRRFKLHILGELGRLGHNNHELQLRLVRLEDSLRQACEDEVQRSARLAGDLALLEERQVRLGAALGRLDDRGEAGAKTLSPLFQDWYLALQHACRGSTAAVAENLARYLPYMIAAPVVDLGCGRGEWVRLLAERGVDAVGVDCNAAMADEAREAGVHVVHADLLDYLRAAAADSFGAVTAFQVVEHLQQGDLLELFLHAWRILKPGGVLLLETPNPENLQVAAFSFWQDPTHVRPLPPPLLAQTAAHFGFVDIQIERSSPWSESMRFADDSEAARHLEKLLFCGQDYALIARKPHVDHPAN